MFNEELDKLRLEVLEAQNQLHAKERQYDALVVDLKFAKQEKENAVKQASLMAEDGMKMKVTITKLQQKVDSLSLVEQENSDLKRDKKELQSTLGEYEDEFHALGSSYENLEAEASMLRAENNDLRAKHEPITQVAMLSGVLVKTLGAIEEEVAKLG